MQWFQSETAKFLYVLLNLRCYVTWWSDTVTCTMSIILFSAIFSATGCAEPSIPKEAWMKHEGESLVVKCNKTQETWTLVCRDTEWVGEVGNCSTDHRGKTFRPHLCNCTLGSHASIYYYLSVWVCRSYVVHHFNGTEVCCAPSTYFVHRWPALFTMVYNVVLPVPTYTLVVQNVALYWLGGAHDDLSCSLSATT